MPAAEIETIRRWIEAGAPWPAGVVVAEGHVAPRRRRADPPPRPVDRELQPRRAADPRRELLRLPRPGPEPPRGRAAPRRRGDGQGPVRLGGRADRRRRAGEERARRPRHRPRRDAAHAAREERQAAAHAAQVASCGAGSRRAPVGAALGLRLALARPAVPRPSDAALAARRRSTRSSSRGIEAAGLRPSPEAERAELLRRAELRPHRPAARRPRRSARSTPTRAPDAYERLVDRLLASPHYGERMAVYWLDLVRYADTVGYHSDNARPMWRYRDWVVSRLQREHAVRPVHRRAARRRPAARARRIEQKIASGYNRLLQTTEEGGAQPKEYRADLRRRPRAQRLAACGWARRSAAPQCHDHKFDPYLAARLLPLRGLLRRREGGAGRPPAAATPLPDAGAEGPRSSALDAKIEAALARGSRGAATPQPAWEEAFAARRPRSLSRTLEPVVDGTSGERRRASLDPGRTTSRVIASTANGPNPRRRTPTPSASRPSSPDITAPPTRGGAVRGAARAAGRAATRRATSSSPGSRSTTRQGVRSAAERERLDRSDGDGFPPRPRSTALRGRGWAHLAYADGESHRLVVELAEPLGTGGDDAHRRAPPERRLRRGTLGRFRAGGATTDARCRVSAPSRPATGARSSRRRARGAERTQRGSRGARRPTTGRPRPSSPSRARALRAAELERTQALLATRPAVATSPTTARARRACASCRAATGSTTPARSSPPAVPAFLPPLDTPAAGARPASTWPAGSVSRTTR